MSEIKIVYSSAGGNTKIICDEVVKLLLEKGHKVELLNAKNLEPSEVGERDLLILASPTHGHGELEKYMAIFMNKLLKEDLTDMPISIIGLGDIKYDDDYHLECIRIKMLALKEKNAKLIGMPLRIVKSPFQWLETLVPMWVDKLDALITNQNA